MARRFTLQLIMDLASRIGANPAKAVSRSNISFLGKGPTKNPLFQNRLAGLENATTENLGKPETLFAAIDDAVGWAKDGKLNSIQTEILGHNLLGIDKILHPPVLPTASVTAIRPGIEGLRRFPKESHRFFGRPLKDKDFSEIDRMVMEGKLPDARGRTWNLKAPETGTGERLYNKLTGLNKPRLVGAPETLPSFLQGPGNITKALDAKTGMSRAIARQILQQDTRIKLKPEELWKMKLGEGEPLDLMRKYYGKSMLNLDEFLSNVNLQAGNPRDLATRVLAEVELIPQFAEGGRIGYGDGFTVGSNKYNINLTPSASIDILKSSEGDYNIKNKNIMMGLASILNLGPYSAGIDYNKLKGKINVDELGDTVFKEGFDDEMLKYKLGYSKDDLDIGLTSNKDLNEFQLTLRKLLKKKPKYIFKKAEGGLAGILQVPTKKASGGRIGFHRGSLRHQKTHDWKSYQKEGPETWGLYGSPPENWLSRLFGIEKTGYNEQRDALESFMKERFMYGEKPPRPNVFKEIWSDVKGLLNKKAEGGRAGYSKGRLVRGALAILNRNKKNAEYMFKASDNVSPGYARGDLKYNAELLADQLAEDAGVLYEDLGALEQTKFYGTAYDYLAAEMGKHLLQKRMMKDIGQKMVLSDFSIKGRKPNASGGLAGILEV